MKRRYRWIILAVAVLLLPLGAAVWSIDNWRRDLTTNEAALDTAADDPLLRPVESPLSADMTAELVTQIAADLPRWEYVETSTEGDVFTLQLTHSTRLFGFVDDIHVTITPDDDGSRLTATSKSRLGKGDLGQNPRNLKELVGEVHRRLESLF